MFFYDFSTYFKKNIKTHTDHIQTTLQTNPLHKNILSVFFPSIEKILLFLSGFFAREIASFEGRARQ